MSAALAFRTSPTAPGVPVVRVRPAPRLEPPDDDEALRGAVPPAPRLPGEPPADWAIAGPTRGGTGLSERAGAAPISEARLAAHRYLSLCLEVLGGFRPPAHLRALTVAEVFEHVVAQLSRPRAGGEPQAWSLRAPAPARPSAARVVRMAGDRVVLRQVRMCEPCDGVAEVAAVLSRGERVWAMALRLERSPGGWLCCHLQVL